MRKKLIWGIAVGTMLALGSAGGAFAGEIGGSGKPAQGATHAKSECAFSGLEDGEEDPTAPSGPGTTQNWGHAKGDTPEGWVVTGNGAAVVTVTIEGVGSFTTGCNAHMFPNPNK